MLTEWNVGIMEGWNIGFKKEQEEDFGFHPLLQYSNVPLIRDS